VFPRISIAGRRPAPPPLFLDLLENRSFLNQSMAHTTQVHPLLVFLPSYSATPPLPSAPPVQVFEFLLTQPCLKQLSGCFQPTLAPGGKGKLGLRTLSSLEASTVLPKAPMVLTYVRSSQALALLPLASLLSPSEFCAPAFLPKSPFSL
jgi:hypothetical protein